MGRIRYKSLEKFKETKNPVYISIGNYLLQEMILRSIKTILQKKLEKTVYYYLSVSLLLVRF